MVACAVGAWLAAAAASAAPQAASKAASKAPPWPFAPVAGDAAARAASGRAVLVLRRHVEERRGGANDGLVPGTAQELSFDGSCESSDPERGSCVGTTTFAFDPAQITLTSAAGVGANCALGPESSQVSCELDLRAEQGYTMSVQLKTDPDARDKTVIELSAVGNYTVSPGQFDLALDPRATLHVTQTPNPMLVENGAYVPLMSTRVLVRNEGPSAAHDAESREAFSAQPALAVDIDPQSEDLCEGGGLEAIHCRFGRIGPGEVRSYRFSAALPSQVPSGASTATITLSADVGAGAPSKFDLLHVGREYVGLLKYPDVVERGQSFDATVEFDNLMPPTAGNDVIPLQWTFDGGDDLELVDYRAESSQLVCQRGSARKQLSCETADISGVKRSGDATLTLRARRSGLVEAKLSWNTALWGHDTSVYTLQVDEPASR
jgi:hypothetical protein